MSDVKFVKLGSIGALLNPFIQFCNSANVNAFGFDLFSLNADKSLNYNIYKKNGFKDNLFDLIPSFLRAFSRY